MKTIVSIFFVLFAVVAIVHATPLPQDGLIAEVQQAAEAEATPNRPVLNAISGLANTGINMVKTVAQNTGRLIEDSAQTVTQGINTAAHTFNQAINLPFQPAPEPIQ